jgi:DNA-binding transcriptional MocR family regulator
MEPRPVRTPSAWTPRLAAGEGPPSERLARAVAEDVRDGRLPPGARMPPHRAVADALGIGVGTATKGYALAERWGLLSGAHGRGTFVAEAPAAEPPGHGPIDLSQNLPPPLLTGAALTESIGRLSRRIAGAGFGLYGPNAGRPEHRAALAAWLAGLGLEVPPDRLALTNGAQHGLALAAGLVARPGDTVLVEAATYHGFRAVADHMGLRLEGLAMDDEGMRPDALDEALARRQAAGGARIVHVLPTRQNPTARTQGADRRRAIAEVCRRRDAWIIEDDVYSFLEEGRLPTLAALAPERTFHATSLSKSVSPGIRLGALAVPEPFAAAAGRAVRATSWTASPLSCLLAAEWLADGTAAATAAAIRAESARRTAMAVAAFPRRLPPGHPASLHVWLPMPTAEAERFARRALAAGVLLTPPDALAVAPELCSGVRICIGAAGSAGALEEALTRLAAAETAGDEVV